MKVFNKLKGVGVKNTVYHLLRRSESFFKTDMVYLAKGGFWLTLGHAIQTVLGLALLVAFANLIPKDVYGTYQFIISTIAIISSFTLTGMGAAITRSVAKGSEGSLRYGLRIQLLWSVGIIVISGILAGYYFLNNNPQVAYALLIAGACQPFITGFGLYKSYLIGKQLFKESSILSIFQKTLPFLVILPTLYLTDNILIIIFVYFISQSVSLFILYLIVIKRHRLPITIEPELSSYSKHLSLMSGFAKISGHLDKVLIWHFLGAAPVAIYTLAQMPIYQLQSILQLSHSLSFTKIAQREFSTLKTVLVPKIRSFFYLVLLIVITYIIISPYIFKTFFANYPESLIYSQLIAISLLAVPRTLIEQALLAHERKRELYILSFTIPFTRIVLLILLLPFFGILGAIAAILITEVLNVALQWRLFKHPLRSEAASTSENSL